MNGKCNCRAYQLSTFNMYHSMKHAKVSIVPFQCTHSIWLGNVGTKRIHSAQLLTANVSEILHTCVSCRLVTNECMFGTLTLCYKQVTQTACTLIHMHTWTLYRYGMSHLATSTGILLHYSLCCYKQVKE